MACIILGVTGSIAAYKAADIASALVKHGHEVHCVCTAKALEFVTPLTLHTISRNPVFSSFEDEKTDWVPPHIQLAQRADLLLIAPATANTMANFAHGFAPDMLSSLYLACQSPVLICPAMNVHMWEHAATQQNAAVLKQGRIITSSAPVNPEFWPAERKARENSCRWTGLFKKHSPFCRKDGKNRSMPVYWFAPGELNLLSWTHMKMLLFFFGSLMLCSCGPDKYPISFHMETGATDSKKFAFERDGHYYSKAPFISHKDIESYYSFPAPDNTYGIVVNVRKGLGSRVEGITAANLGRQILPIVNGHAMQPLRLYSKPVTSGKLAVMGGFSPADLAAMAEFIPPADPKREEPINKLAAVTKPLLPSKNPAQEKKEAKDPEEHKDRTVISTRRGRI